MVQQCPGRQKEIKQMIGVQKEKNLMLLQKAEGTDANDAWEEGQDTRAESSEAIKGQM